MLKIVLKWKLLFCRIMYFCGFIAADEPSLGSAIIQVFFCPVPDHNVAKKSAIWAYFLLFWHVSITPEICAHISFFSAKYP